MHGMGATAPRCPACIATHQARSFRLFLECFPWLYPGEKERAICPHSDESIKRAQLSFPALADTVRKDPGRLGLGAAPSLCCGGVGFILRESVTMPSSRGSFRPRDQTCVSCVSRIGRQILHHCTTWEASEFQRAGSNSR